MAVTAFGERRRTSFYDVVASLSRPVVCGLFRLRVDGLEHVPTSGGFVVASNHLSNFDPWPLGVALYPRRVHHMAKAELWNPLLRPLLRAAGAFPVHRGERDVEAFQTAVRLVRDGHVMGMFPEGTRRVKGMRKKHRPYPHTGAAGIALLGRVPLVPAAVYGTDHLRRLGPIRVAFGPPIPLNDLSGLDAHHAAQEATHRLWAEIQRLEAELATASR